MKSKLLLCLALVLSGCFCSQNVQAYWSIIPINRTNTATVSFVRIIPPVQFGLTNSPLVGFSVFVLPNDNAREELLSGSLTVNGSETNSYLVRTMVQAEEPPGIPEAVPKSWAGKCKVFHFYIAANLLTNSTFSVDYTIDPKWGTAGTSYVFNLKEFAAVK